MATPVFSYKGRITGSFLLYVFKIGNWLEYKKREFEDLQEK